MNTIRFNIEEINYNTDYIHKLGKPEDFDEFVHFMILNNEIAGLVPYVYEAGSVPQLRYSVSKNISLSDFLKNKITDSGVYFDIMLNILGIVARTEEYMIEQRYLLFNNDYIFINTNSFSVKMMCIPDCGAEASSLGRFMTDLLKSVQFDSRVDCSFKTDIYEYDFDYSDTEEIIRFFNNLKVKRQAPTPMVNRAPEPVPRPVPAVEQPVQTPKPAPEQKPAAAPKPSGLFSGFSGKAAVPSAPPAPEKNEQKQKSSLFHFGGNKKEKSEPEMSLNIPDMPAIPADKKEKAKPAASGFAGLSFPGKSKTSGEMPVLNIPKKENKREEPAPVIEQSAPVAVKITREEREMDGSDDGSTVFLQAPVSSGTAQLIDSDGSVTVISGEVFTIGRGGKTGIQIDMIIDSKTVSRFHASIYSEGGCYYIMDHDSPNGTYVNNVRVKPNIKTPVMDGAKIRFSDKNYTFVIS